MSQRCRCGIYAAHFYRGLRLCFSDVCFKKRVHCKVGPGTICDSAVRPRVSRGHPPPLSFSPSLSLHPSHAALLLQSAFFPSSHDRSFSRRLQGSKTLLIQLQYAQPSPLPESAAATARGTSSHSHTVFFSPSLYALFPSVL